MKKKFSIWLNIVTICLCVCAIAIGVYSATTATLKVSGQVGFKAHDCSVTITGFSIDNSSRTAEATESTTLNTYLDGETEKTIPAEGIPVSGTTPVAFNMGKFYFVDDLVQNKVPDIVITFNIHNTSAYPVTATMTETISSNDKYEDITVLGGTWTKTFGANDNKAGGYDENTLSITLRLTNPATADLSQATLGEMFSVEFNKDIGAHAEGEMYIGEDNKLYVEYGNYPYTDQSAEIFDKGKNKVDEATMYGDNLKKPIRWIAFTDDMSTPYEVDENKTIPTTGNLYFVSEYAFDAHVFNSVTDKPVQGKNPNDYETSEINAYLQGDFVAKFSLNNLTAKAVARNLPGEELNIIVDGANYSADGDGNKYVMSGDEQAKLWLLENSWLKLTTELDLVNSVTGSNIAYYPSQAEQLALATVTEYGANYWTRTHDEDYYADGSGVYIQPYDNESERIFMVNKNNIFAIRPGFQINLGA